MERTRTAILAAISAVIFLTSSAHAACSKNENDQLVISGNDPLSICRTDAERIIYQVNDIGLCKALPEFTTSAGQLDSCESVLANEISVDLTFGSTQEAVDVVRPPNGDYTYFYVVIENEAQYQGVAEYAQQIAGGTETGEPGILQGRFCQAPNYPVNLDHMYQSPSSYASHCTDTSPEIKRLSTVRVNNFFANTFQPIMSVPESSSTVANFTPSADAYQNVYLLDQEKRLAESSEGISFMLTVMQKQDPITINNETEGLRIGFNLTDAINAYTFDVNGTLFVSQVVLNGRTVTVDEQ
ncbi:hypothetical protein N9Y79_03805 [Alphaproteobacteria bacterium]|nr:hypothetical protein [Alphaproteobacteria bacterium]